MKSIYVLQPYEVGSKISKSLAIIIPAEVREECNIDISTPFALYPDKKSKKVTLMNLKVVANLRQPAGESLEASSQQAPSGEVQ